MTMLIRAPIALTVTLCFARLILSGARCRSGGCCEEVCGTYCDENHACHSDDERCQNVGEACAAPKSAPMPTPKHTPKPRHQLATNQTVQCAAEPVSLFVIQNNCMGSTWLGHLLEQHECVQRVRHPSNPDGSFHGDVKALLNFTFPQKPERPGDAYTSGALIYSRTAASLAWHVQQRGRRPRGRKLVVAVLVRESVFQAICSAKKHAMSLRLQSLRRENSTAVAKCDINQPNPDHCPFAINFTWQQDPDELLRHWRIKECNAQIMHREAARLAATLNVKPIVIDYAELACSHGVLPRALRSDSILGQSPSSRRRALGTKLTSPNSARAMENVEAVAAYFERHGHGADARRLRSASEACSETTTVRHSMWKVLKQPPDSRYARVDENDEQLTIKARALFKKGKRCRAQDTSEDTRRVARSLAISPRH